MSSKIDTFLDSRFAYPLLFALVFALSILMQCLATPGVDQHWYALMTQRMLDGVALYKDFIEVNMPMVLWLYALPVTVAGKLGTSPEVMIRLAVVGLIACLLPVYACVLRHSSLWTPSLQRSFLLALVTLLLVSTDAGDVFSQRSHLLMVLTLPYLLFNLPSIRQQECSRRAQCAFGALAAVGYCLKPYDFIMWGALLLYKLCNVRSWRVLFGPAELTIGCCVAAYIAALALFTPYYLGFAGVFVHFYGGAGEDLGRVIKWYVWITVIAVLLAWRFQLFRIHPAAPYKKEVRYLMWMAFAAYIECVVQLKDWLYIAYPFMLLGMLAVFAMILFRPFSGFWTLLFVPLVFFPSVVTLNVHKYELQKADRIMEKAIMPYEQSRDFYYIGLKAVPGPLLRPYAPLAWSGKFLNLYELKAVMQTVPESGQPTLTVKPGKEWIERWLLDNLADDLEKKQPDLLVIARDWNTKYTAKADSFDLLEWFKHEPRLLHVMQQYSLQKEVEVCSAPKTPFASRHCTYRVFTRKPTAP